MAKIWLFDPIYLFSYALAIFVSFAAGLLFINRGFKRKNPNEKLLLFGLGGSVVGMGILHLCVVFSYFFYVGTYTKHTFYVQLDIFFNYVTLNPEYLYLQSIGTITLWISVLFFLFLCDRALRDTAYISTLLCLILGLIVVFTLNTAFEGFYLILITISFIRICERSNKEFETMAVYFLIGFLIYMLGTIFGNWFLLDLYNIPYLLRALLRPLLYILAMLFYTLPLIANPDFLRSRSLFHWSILIVVGIVAMIIWSFIQINTIDLMIAGWRMGGYFNWIFYLSNMIIIILSMTYAIYRIVKKPDIDKELDETEMKRREEEKKKRSESFKKFYLERKKENPSK